LHPAFKLAWDILSSREQWQGGIFKNSLVGLGKFLTSENGPPMAGNFNDIAMSDDI